MIRSFALWGKNIAAGAVPLWLLFAAACSSTGLSYSRELNARLDEVRTGGNWKDHVAWFRSEPNVGEALRNGMREHRHSAPEYAMSLAFLSTVLTDYPSAAWERFYMVLVRESLRDDWGRLGNREKVGCFVTLCLRLMGRVDESYSVALDVAERHPSDMVRRAALGVISGSRKTRSSRERGALLAAARSDTAYLAGKALFVMGQMKYREGRFIAKRYLSEAESSRYLRTASASYLFMLGDDTALPMLRAYLAELVTELRSDAGPADTERTSNACDHLRDLVEAMVDTPVPSTWVGELTELANCDRVSLRKMIASELGLNPERDLLGVAKKLAADKDTSVRQKAGEAVKAIEGSMEETFGFMEEVHKN